MVNKIHYRWDFVGLSTDTKPTPEESPKVVNGSTYYESDTSKLFVFYKDTWYERKPLGGGGGSSYTAGDGIDITNNTISVDTEVIQPKLTAGTNITIDENNVISAGAGGGATLLTSDDYDYPADNPDGVALWRLPAGMYYAISGTKVYYSTGSNSSNDQTIIISNQDGNYYTDIIRIYSAGGQNTYLVYKTEKNTGRESIEYSNRSLLLSDRIVQTTGTSTTNIMSQYAVSSVLFDDPAGRTRVKIGERAAANGNQSVAIGHWARSGNPSCVAIGGSNDVTSAAAAIGDGGTAVGSGARIGGGAGGSVGNFGTVVGYNASVAGATAGVAIGAYSKATEKGQFDISTMATTNTYGYNNSQYRLLTGLYDPQNAHDAATKGYVDTAVAGAGGSDGARTLKQSDYNWPADNPDGVALWLMPVGFYRASNEEPVKVYITSTFSYTANATNFAVMVTAKDNGVELVQWHYSYDSVAPIYADIYNVNPITGAQSYRHTLKSGVVTSLTSTSSTIPLAANQGKALKDLIDALDARVTALEGN